MLGGAYRAVRETDLKRVLAYSTISALGVLMLLLGIGTAQAVTAGLVYLLAHACYKGALFLVAGAVEHETGTRDVAALGGLRRLMPRTALAASLAAVSMAGVPLFSRLHRQGAVLRRRVGLRCVGRRVGDPRCRRRGRQRLAGSGRPHGRVRRRSMAVRWHPPMRMKRRRRIWLGPLLLGVVGLAIGVMPALARDARWRSRWQP